MDARHHEQLSARAEFYLCLARAFLAPRDEALAHAMRDALAEDLGELAARIGYEIAAPLAHYQEQIGRLTGAETLLQVYSALFLAPPVPARINAGMYLDGAMNGGSVRAMEEAYQACGVERDAAFPDLSDHVSVQLEFVAMLYRAQAARYAGEIGGEPLPVDPGQFLHRFARCWVGPLCTDLARATAQRELAANPYLPLARIVETAAACDAVAPEIDARESRKQLAIEHARARYAAQGIGAEDLAKIRRKLEARGLSTEHLDVPLDGRDATMGLSRKTPPGLR